MDVCFIQYYICKVAIILDTLFKTTIGGLPYGLFYYIYAFFILIPRLAVGVRRLPDVGKSGWMILVTLFPIVGFIWLLVLLFTDSESGSNSWG